MTTTKHPSLVVLAAGVGSRYGGLKQLEPVGAGRATLIDYAIFDAARAGFGRVVIVVRPGMEPTFRRNLPSCSVLPGRDGEGADEPLLPVSFAVQRPDGLPHGFSTPADRTKPWGTGHAVLACEEEIREPFGVVNADDFYGRESYEILCRFLQQGDAHDAVTAGLVSFRLRDTLVASGSVNRAICRSSPEGWLSDIEEIIGIEREGEDGVYVDASGVREVLAGDTAVSMNMWGFSPAIFALLRDRFVRFLDSEARRTEAEFYLPAAVQEMIREDDLRVRILSTMARWCGVTHPKDRERVQAEVERLTDRGDYPKELWR